MAEPVTIRSVVDAPEGLDYASLRAEGVALVQALSGAVWTDYNAHDPGVTILEQLCYALTELGYRSRFSLADLLCDEHGRIDPRRHALFVARRNLVCNPVTQNDYRRLLIDRVAAVRNVWLDPLPGQPRGLYRIRVYAPGLDPCSDLPEANPEGLLERVRAVYLRHRGLCEDLGEQPTLLREQPAELGARVTIADDADPDEVMASILFSVGELLAPEPKRRSLAECLAAGLTPDMIFSGPLLREGFIADDELQAKAESVPISEVAGVIADLPSVVGVRDVALAVGRVIHERGEVPVGRDEILVLQTQCPAPRGRPTIQLYRKRGVACSVDCRRVDRLTRQLWQQQRQRYPLREQYRELLGVPRGQARDLSAYTSIQDQFPNTYGINAYGLPADASAPRRGQAKQLKGYLLPFEQLLADFFAQLAHVRDLYSIDPALEQTYWSKSLCGSVPNVEPLLDGGCGPSSRYQRGLEALVASTDPVLERRDRQGSFLLALHGERLDPADVYVGVDLPRVEAERLLAAKFELLELLVESSRDRGRGFDYAAREPGDSVAGMTIKSRIQLGMPSIAAPSLADRLDELALEVIPSSGTPTLGRLLGRHAEHIQTTFEPVEGPDDPDPLDEPEPSEGQGWLRAQTITAEFLAAGRSLANYRFGSLRGDEGVVLVCRVPESDRWCFVGRYRDSAAAGRGARAMVEQINELDRRSQQLFVIEHILLRDASEPDFAANLPPSSKVEPGAPLRFEYGGALTAVIASSRVDEAGFRRFASEVIRSNAPAHLSTRCRFLDPAGLVRFEELYWPWRRALAGSGDLPATSRRLRDYLADRRGGEGE